MKYIAHRINTIAALQKLDTRWGAEIDLRSDCHTPGKIILAHDAWSAGDDFRDWTKVYRSKSHQGPLILNTKEDGLETRAIEILEEFGVKDYFFLDTTLPTTVKFTKTLRNPNFAIRVSQYEPLINAENFEGDANWIWVDCFHGNPMNAAELAPLLGKFKFCLVSPELQGQKLESSLAAFKELAQICDAICTKSPETWISVLAT